MSPKVAPLASAMRKAHDYLSTSNSSIE